MPEKRDGHAKSSVSVDGPHWGGAIPLGSKFYVERYCDQDLQTAIRKRNSLVLIKGPWQAGKSSLLLRAYTWAEALPARVVLSNFQHLDQDCFQTTRSLYRALANGIAESLKLQLDVEAVWDERRSACVNFNAFLRHSVLNECDSPVFWLLDEVDRLLMTPFAPEVFGLFRSWHENRAFDPSGPWGRLSIIIAYSTEAHLFTAELNQSPLNVGTRIILGNFTMDQVRTLNGLYNSPLSSKQDISRLGALVGGQPYLVMRALHYMSIVGCGLEELELEAIKDDGPFAHQLSTLALQLANNSALRQALRSTLEGKPDVPAEVFYLLRQTGLISRAGGPDDFSLYGLYERFLKSHPSLLKEPKKDSSVVDGRKRLVSARSESSDTTHPGATDTRGILSQQRAQRFDVFLSHSSTDKASVRQLGEALRSRGLSVWLDEWELVPGRPWQEALEEALRVCRTAAVLVGAEGLGPWEIPDSSSHFGLRG